MKIVFINGSPKKRGVTAAVLNEIDKQMTIHEEVESEIIHLSDYKMEYCTGCTTCYSKGFCPLDQRDGFDKIRKSIENADGVILGSPNYVSSVTGGFKNFIDRMDFVTGQKFYNKFFMSVVTYQNLRGSKVANYIAEQGRLAGGISKGQIVLKVDPYEKPYNIAKYSRKISKQTRYFYDSIKNRKKRNLIELIISFVVKQNLKKFAKDEKNYAGLISLWKAKGIL